MIRKGRAFRSVAAHPGGLSGSSSTTIGTISWNAYPDGAPAEGHQRLGAGPRGGRCGGVCWNWERSYVPRQRIGSVLFRDGGTGKPSDASHRARSSVAGSGAHAWTVHTDAARGRRRQPMARRSQVLGSRMRVPTPPMASATHVSGCVATPGTRVRGLPSLARGDQTLRRDGLYSHRPLHGFHRYSRPPQASAPRWDRRAWPLGS
jgi:hypothetical protein